MAKISQRPKLHPNGQLCIQRYPSTGTCGDGMEKSIESPRMGEVNFWVVIGNAKVNPAKNYIRIHIMSLNVPCKYCGVSEPLAVT